MRLLDKHWPEDIFPTKVPRSDTGRDPGPTIVSLLRWIDRLQATPVPGEFVDIPAQEFVSIPIPPDTETVELVAAAMAEAVYCDGTWLRLAAEKKADYRRYARAAPPRPHGGEHRWRVNLRVSTAATKQGTMTAWSAIAPTGSGRRLEMDDARTLLERYARQDPDHVVQNFTHAAYSPRAFNALRAVLDLCDERSTATAYRDLMTVHSVRDVIADALAGGTDGE